MRGRKYTESSTICKGDTRGMTAGKVQEIGLQAIAVLMGIRLPFDRCRYRTISEEIRLLQSH